MCSPNDDRNPLSMDEVDDELSQGGLISGIGNRFVGGKLGGTSGTLKGDGGSGRGVTAAGGGGRGGDSVFRLFGGDI